MSGEEKMPNLMRSPCLWIGSMVNTGAVWFLADTWGAAILGSLLVSIGAALLQISALKEGSAG